MCAHKIGNQNAWKPHRNGHCWMVLAFWHIFIYGWFPLSSSDGCRGFFYWHKCVPYEPWALDWHPIEGQIHAVAILNYQRIITVSTRCNKITRQWMVSSTSAEQSKWQLLAWSWNNSNTYDLPCFYDLSSQPTVVINQESSNVLHYECGCFHCLTSV